MCDSIGKQMTTDNNNTVIDDAYFSHQDDDHYPMENWVFQEMWTYFPRSFPTYRLIKFNNIGKNQSWIFWKFIVPQTAKSLNKGNCWGCQQSDLGCNKETSVPLADAVDSMIFCGYTDPNTFGLPHDVDHGACGVDLI